MTPLAVQTGKISSHKFRFASQDERDRWHIGLLEQVAALIAEVNGASGGASDVPYPWTVEKTAEGEVYYYNEETGATSWDAPTATADSANDQSKAV